MRTELEEHDIEAVAQKVIELLTPIINRQNKGNGTDTIFDVKGLSKYLKVEPSWIYKQVQYNSLPYFKLGKYVRFKKSAIDKHIEKSSVQAVS